MSSARDLISRAHRLAGLVESGDALPEATYQDGLAALNDMIDGWNTQRLYIVSVAEVTASVSASPATIGPAMTINTARPVAMEDGAFVRSGDVDYPLTWIDREQYAAIASKAITSTLPQYGYYDAAMPTGKIYLWPAPSAAVELHIPLQVQLTEFADLSTDYTLAPGYRKAIAYSLAGEIASGPNSQEVARQAAMARKAIKRSNVRIPLAQMPAALTRHTYDIREG